MTKRAVITGITGQDGSYLAELLLGKEYEVHGIVRRASSLNTTRIDHLLAPAEGNGRPGLHLHYGDLTDGTSLRCILAKIEPDEVYNLGAQSHVRISFDEPEYTADADAIGTVRLLEAVRDRSHSTGRQIRFYQAGSSEMFGASPPPQSETSPFLPRSPYAISKVAAHWFCVNYREAYGLFTANGILFNHESPRRGEAFVTRKITRGLTRIKLGLDSKLFLGDLDAKRDWGYAGDYVEAMWLMLQQPKPADFVIATGQSHSVREFLDEAARLLSMDWDRYVAVDPRLVRPTEIACLEGDASNSREVLGWRPRVHFSQLVRMMVEHDLALAEREAIWGGLRTPGPARRFAASYV